MAYWLMKTEPDTFSIDDLKKKGSEFWDGVRNYQARNMLRDDMKLGDLTFIYHSNCDVPGIYGIGKIVKAAYPDFSALNPDSKYYDPKASTDNPRWYGVEVGFVEKLKAPITLSQMKTSPALHGFKLLDRGNRLSILPVQESHWQLILSLKVS